MNSILKRQISFIETLTIILAIVIMLCLLNPGSVSLFTILISLLVASIIAIGYILTLWNRIDMKARMSGILSILAWLALFYSFIHMNGLTISSYFRL